MLIYLASPYSHHDDNVREKNYIIVTEKAAEFIAKGDTVISPITYGHTILKYSKNQMPTNWDFWKDFCLSILEKCDKMYVLKMPGWDKSIGVHEEIQYASKKGIPIEFINYHSENQETI